MRTLSAYLTILLVGSLLYSCGAESNNKLEGGTRTDVLGVDYVVVQPQPLIHNIEVTGTLMPNEVAQLTTQSAGKIQSITFEEGEQVNKGQVLVQIDDREWQAQLQRLESELETAEKDLERKQQLAEVKGVTETELEEAIFRKESLEANIQEIEVRLDHATITAPFSGRIGLRSVSPGSFINSGSSVAMLVQDDPLKLQFNVPERYASKLKKGQAIRFTVAGTDEVFTADIYATEPMISESTRALRARARARNPEGKLIPGAYADVMVSLDSIPNAFLVPTESIIPQLNEQTVYRISGGQAEQVIVKTGVREPYKVQVTSGLEAGDTIMVSGLLQVKPGMAVRGDEQIEVESFEKQQ